MNFIDLFSGCGGFSLGMRWAGFEEIAAIDMNSQAIQVMKANFPSVRVLQKDLTIYTPENLLEEIGDQEIDVIIGGPPCQGYSTVRQRDGSNSGSRIINDERRELYQELLKFVGYFRPKLFIMENVLGIKSAASGHFYRTVQSQGRDLGYRVHSETIKAWEYGVPQKRERQFIFGSRLDLPIFSGNLYLNKTHSLIIEKNKEPIVTLWEAIGDLPELIAGEGFDDMDYDLRLRNNQLIKYSGRYIFDILEVNKCLTLTSHRARPHNPRDLRDFLRIREGENGAKTISRGIELETPYDKTTFKDRYTRQHRDKLCSTIVAHLSKDGLMFIHPTQNRSLTPREAARIQSFPDSFCFPVSRTQQFQLIGNAVPPLIGKALGFAIHKWYMDCELHQFSVSYDLEEINKNEKCLKELLSSNYNGSLSKIPDEVLLNGWRAILFFNYYLHPDSLQDNGNTINNKISNYCLHNNHNYDCIEQGIFELSGWPVKYVPYAQEFQKRIGLGKIPLDFFYCNTSLLQGFHFSQRGVN